MEFSEKSNVENMVQVHIKSYDNLSYRTEVTESEAITLIEQLKNRKEINDVSII